MATPAAEREEPANSRRRDASLLKSILRAVAALAVVSLMGLWLTRTFWDDAAQNQSIRDLSTGSKEERLIAAGRLVATPRPEQAERVIDALIMALLDDDDEVRSASVITLGTVVRQLLDSWKHDPELLRKKEPLAAAASRAMMAVLKDSEADVKYKALHGLLTIHVGYVGPRAPLPQASLVGVPPDELRPALLTALADQSPGVRAMAAEVLARLGPLLSSDIPRELVAALDDESRQVRENAAWACDSYKERLSPLVPDLFTRLEQAKPPYRSALWHCLERGTAMPSLVPFLRERLKSPSPHVRSAAASILARMGPKAAAATPELLELLHDPSVPGNSRPPRYEQEPNPARSAAWALSTFPPTSQIVKALAANLGSHVSGRAGDAVWYLGEIGPGARAAVPALIASFRTQLSMGQTMSDRGIPWALSKIAPGTEYEEASVAVLIEALDSKGLEVRRLAATALGAFGPRARGAIPLLKRLAEAPGVPRESARRALRAIDQAPGSSADESR